MSSNSNNNNNNNNTPNYHHHHHQSSLSPPPTMRMQRTVSSSAINLSPPPLPIASTESYLFPRPQSKSLLKKGLFDLAVLVILGISILLFNLKAVPYHRGFNCNDDSIRYPFRGDTITTSALVAYSLTIPIVMIMLNEVLIVIFSYNREKLLLSEYSRSSVFWYCLGWQWYMQLAPFLFAATTSQMITEIAKYSIGRLRPCFIDLCEPKFTDRVTGQQVTLTRFSAACNEPFVYIEDYTCTTTAYSEKLLKDVHLSFMSGHSSFSAVCLLYLVLYLQSRFNWTSLGLVKHLLQAGLVFLTFYTGMSRISDYKHHWSDVLIGLLQGTLVAVMVARYVSDLVQLRSVYAPVHQQQLIQPTFTEVTTKSLGQASSVSVSVDANV